MVREYYSIPEAAARLGLSRIAVFKKVKKGQLEALRVGRNWAVPAAALEKASAPNKQPGISAGAHGSIEPASVRGNTPLRSVHPQPPKEVSPPPSPDAEMDSMGWD